MNLAHVYRPTRDHLTPIEREVLDLVAQGLTNKEIAYKRVCSQETIKSHLRNIIVKLNARSRAHAVSIGYQKGLL